MNILDPQRAINDKASDKHQLIVLTQFFQIVCQGIKIQWIMILLLKVNLSSNFEPNLSYKNAAKLCHNLMLMFFLPDLY